MKYVIATHNKHKVEEFHRILSPLGIEAVTADLEDVEETGTTFAENAELKARAACEETGLPAIADDSGLMVDVLNGEPGVYSARYAGEGAGDLACIQKLLKNMEHIPPEQRTAKFVCAICCIYPDGKKIEVQGECPGHIAFEMHGDNGFGYDPVFLVGEKSFAELDGAPKDKISHRGNALRLLVKELEKKKEQQYAEQ